MSKVAIIFGVTGQDGSYMAELLLSKGYKVIGTERPTVNYNRHNILDIVNNVLFIIEQCEITDFSTVSSIVLKYQASEIYNFSALSSVKSCWDQPLQANNINYNGVINIIEAIRLYSPNSRFAQTSTSNVYGECPTDFQDEETPINPIDPYACSKAAAESMINTYKKAYGLFLTFARCYNHESVKRPTSFLTRKITNTLAKILKNETNKLVLGNLDIKRDFSHAKDMVNGLYLILQQKKPDNYVLGSGIAWSVKDILDFCFDYCKLDWKNFVEIDSQFIRPSDTQIYRANSFKAKNQLGWIPQISFQDTLIEILKKDIGDSIV